ncbi:thioesterase family protein [Amycolatopsis sp. FDAARGOS 1241]|uniref:acyl-CoA thioesterase n=1 Tax=Amycolatopsis sp. FDAARGOS 1241 TaxID=2778070 RepID=UPI00194E03EE|nr:thioesterase family protein [Amycolatopsis sp. FDAARGOS 1241]QRP48199.1 thioesterase family protein [Amycolatopsis sp. FDAARGOS 1241]
MTYVSHVQPRWSDMDVYGHVNHANLVTLLEEARIPVLFGDAVKAGLTELPQGVVVVKLAVHYRTPIVVEPERKVRVEITLAELKAASITLAYRVHTGPEESDPVAVTAETVLAPYDTGKLRPRRLTTAETEFLKKVFADA